METVMYISLAIPFILGFVLIIFKLKEVTSIKYKEREKNSYSFAGNNMRKDKLKIPGYYEDFFTADKEKEAKDIKDPIASVSRFMNGGTWI